MRFSALITSFVVAAALSGCGVIRQDVSRSNVDVLSFPQNTDAVSVESQAVLLNNMAAQLARRSAGPSAADQQVEPVLAADLVNSLRDIDGQMSALQSDLPALLERQNAELTDLRIRRDVRAISRKKFDKRVLVIQESRATISDALTKTVLQIEQASQNMTDAMAQGQSGLEWHVEASNQLAQEAELARSTVPLLKMTPVTPNERLALIAPPRSGELR